MYIKEFRIVLPLTVEEYQIGQLYSVAEASKNETGGGEGVEVLSNEPFQGVPLLNGQFNNGQYTHKIYHLASKVPSIVRFVAPKGSLEIDEEAWNAYPYCRTVLTNPGYMKDNFLVCVESLHLSGNDDLDNVHQLPPEKLKKREVVRIDIANDSVKDYKESEDPSKFLSEKTGRGRISGNWKAETRPLMTCYKLVYAKFKWFGLQNKIESFIQDTERRVFLNFHRQVFCWIDRWHGLTIQDIRDIEENTRRELDELRRTGAIRGSNLEA